MTGMIKQRLIEEFINFENKLNGQKKSKIHNIREKAFDFLKSLNPPTRKDEEWRFTNVGFVNQLDFNLDYTDPDDKINPEDLKPFLIKDLRHNLMVFVNGVYSQKLSNINYPKDEIIIESFAEAEKRNAPNLLKYFSEVADYKDDFFTSLNTSFANDGVYVNIPAGVYIDEPLHIIYLNDARQSPAISNPRNLFVIGKCSRFRIVETYHTLGSYTAFTNMVSEVVMNFASNLEFNKIQNDIGDTHYIGTMNVLQEKNSEFNSSIVTLGGKFIRNNQNIKFIGENADTSLNGFYYLKNNDFVDNHTLIDHTAPNCKSDEYFKGILDDNSRAVFSGKVLVRPDAQKTNAFQKNKNILLTDNARIYTKPQLEIFADDVKCSHGATSGYLDKDALFYLRSRGIREELAKSLLLNAFAGDIIGKIKIDEIRDEIKRNIAERLLSSDIYFCDVLGDIYDDLVIKKELNS